MRTSRLILVCVCALVLAPGGAGAAATFASPREALKQGLGAYQGGYFDQAIPALESAAEDGEFMALYYLARIYSDNSGAHTAHAKAYQLFKRIVDEYADLDPDEDERAPLVGRSLTALANYTRRGLPEIGLAANLERAIEYLHNASVIFNDEDAQFELAKLQLTGEGVAEDVPKAKHWLSVLTQRGHAGAQAFLADLLWRGKYMAPDQPRALALISIAVENAPSNERLWIEDIYQNIFCGAGDGIRRQASGIVAGWGNRYGRKPDERDRSDLDQLNAAPLRTCQNGETVGPIKGEFAPGEDGGAIAETPQRQPRGFLQGSSGAGLRDVAAPDQPRGDR
jgi:TPR repeat protein